jgi:formylglycine-generating enzyme required for sulfatase activity
VGNPGNLPDPATGNQYGSVGYIYQMGTYDVTLAQYTAFLNAVATQSDPYGLYDSGMATAFATQGISQSGSPGSYIYSVIGSNSQAANCPVFDVSWGDAARFCNWLDNGQRTSGTEAAGTTETGAYNLITSSGTGATTNADLMAVTRSAGADYWIPTDAEWYKAAYYKSGGTNAGYWTYPTQSDNPPSNSLPDTGNHANFLVIQGSTLIYTDPVNRLTPVGAFSESPGPYGTFDQGGEVYQWLETVVDSSRGFRGGSFDGLYYDMAASQGGGGNPPTSEQQFCGFRIAGSTAVPEPSTLALILAGAVGSLAYAWRRRAKA